VNRFAVALVLPDEVEQILDSLRGEYARHMKYIDIPHVSLAYPFAPRVDKGLVAEKLKLVAEKTRPFRLALNGIRYFEEESNVAYLAIADPKPVIDLHYAISRSISGITKDDYGLKFSFANFVPHVTIGDAIPADILPNVKESLSKATPYYEFRITDFGLFAEDDAGTWEVAERFTLAG
jgi:2'-5' RNA ligase